MRRICTLAVFSLAVLASFGAAAWGGTLVIRNPTVVDVRTGELIAGRDIVVREGVIEGLVRGGTAVAARDGGVVAEVDASGLYAIPGLFDAHVHLSAAAESYAPLLVAHGVTAARDLGAPTRAILALKRAYASGEALGPDLVVTGAIIDGDPPTWPFSEVAADAEQARAAVRLLHREGVDMIKVYSRLTKGAYEAAVAEAHALGLKVTGHIPESVTLEEAIAAGQDCNEHLMRIDTAIAGLAGEAEERNRPMARMFSGWASFDDVPREELEAWARSLGESGMVQCPTLAVMKGIGRTIDPTAPDDPAMAYVPGFVREFWGGEAYSSWAEYAAAIVGVMQKTVKLFHDSGVPMMVGTDLANPYVFAGQSVHEEMALWQEAGVPALDVLRAATVVPAAFCGLGETHGAVEPGKAASIVLVRKNPLEDIRHAAEVEHVILRGTHYDRAALDGVLEGVRERIANEAGAQPEEGAGVAVDLPGVEVARGVFQITFGKFDAGSEHFVITRDDDGYHFFADLRPKGGGQIPSTITARAGQSGQIKSVRWNQRAAPPVEAVYTIGEGTLTATATREDIAQPAQTVAFTETHILSVPAIASGFLEYRALALEPGETRELTVLAFGYPDWRTQPSPYKVTRAEDTTIEIDGVPTECARYIAETTTPIGLFRTESWVDDDLLPHRAVITMPFGVVTFVRE